MEEVGLELETAILTREENEWKQRKKGRRANELFGLEEYMV